MHDNKMKYLLLAVSMDTLSEAGIDQNAVLEIYADGSRVIIQAVDDTNILCSGDCDHCPISETDCDGNCEDCPCFHACEEAEVCENE